MIKRTTGCFDLAADMLAVTKSGSGSVKELKKCRFAGGRQDGRQQDILWLLFGDILKFIVISRQYRIERDAGDGGQGKTGQFH